MDIIELAEYGVIVENNPVVVDENIITSYCPECKYVVFLLFI